jgi:hypothetical protein
MELGGNKNEATRVSPWFAFSELSFQAHGGAEVGSSIAPEKASG